MPNQAPDFEGLQVAIDHTKEVNRDNEGLQHIPTQTPGIYYHPPYSNGGTYYDPNTAGYPPSAPPPAAQGQGQKRTICGLKPVVFWVFVVILSAMVIGGAVGGGVGGTIAARNNSNNDNTAQSDTTSTNNPPATQTPTKASSSSTTPSTTSSAPVTSGTTGMASNPCPSINGTTIRASTGSLFAVYCSVDWPNGDDAANGNGTVKDLKPSYFRYTLDDCITSCVDYNKGLGAGEEGCKAVTYAANLTSASEQGGNCYLKDRVGVYMEGSFGSMSAGIVGG